MANTAAFLAEVRDIVGSNQTAAAQSGRQGTVAENEDVLVSQSESILGLAYAVPYEEASSKGWIMRGVRPVRRAGQFVYERPDHTGSHSFVKPAALGQSFFVRSTMLGENDTEEWRTDKSENYQLSVFPNLDIILSNAKHSPEAFAKAFVDQGWATNTQLLGPLAQHIRQHIHLPTVTRALEDYPNSRQIMILDAVLSIAQDSDGRNGSTRWIGCPVFPDQLLVTIQRRISKHTGSNWQAPALDQTVKLIGDLTAITDQARDLAKAIVLNRAADWSAVRKLTDQVEEMREAVQLLTSMSWEEACQVAHSPDLPTTLQLLQQRERRMAKSQGGQHDRNVDGWRLPVNTGTQGVPTFVLTREPADGDPKLSPDERDELEEVCKADATRQLTIEKARLLTESTGVSIIALQPGGPDISRVKMPYFAESLLRKVQEEMWTTDSLRKVPLVTMAKIFSLRLTPNDNFIFEHLGLLVSEDFSTDVALTKMRGATQGGQVIKAKKHRWAAVNSLEDLSHIVEGLAMCVQRFHHPSVFSHQGIFDLWAKLTALYVSQGGHAHLAGLFNVFKTRIEEHSLAIRTRNREATDPLPNLAELQSRSTILFNQVLEAAKQQCLRDYAAMRSGPGDTAYSARRSGTEAIDADGKRVTHAPHGKMGVVTSPQSGKTSAGASTPSATKRGVEADPQQSSTRGQNKRPKQTDRTSPCVRCMKPGHEWYACTKQWAPIPRGLPSFLRSLAVKAREENGIDIVYVTVGGAAEGTPGERQD